ncbi:MAG: glycosyltransferase 87 family protein, partial [Rubritepida sp.]|nr:glycosyltransferase 87 family protein [Rubritepida sp.]
EAGAALHAALPFAHLRSIYPGTAQAGFALAHLLAPFEMLGLRLVMLGGEAATLALMLALLRRAGWPAGRAAIWWCCPLLPVLLIGNAHVDALLVPLLLGAAWAALAGRGALAGVLLGLAVGVKLWPVLLAPLLARALPRRAWPGAALGLALAAGVTVAPLLASLAAPDAGLRAYAGQWLVNNAPFAWGRAALGLLVEQPDAWLRPGAALLGGLAALLVAWRAPPGPAGLLGGMMAIGAVTFYLSPANYPWYALWFLPFAALTAFRPLLLAAVVLPVYWLWFPMDRAGLSGVYNHSLAALHVLPVAAALWWRWR